MVEDLEAFRRLEEAIEEKREECQIQQLELMQVLEFELAVDIITRNKVSCIECHLLSTFHWRRSTEPLDI